MPPLSFVPNSLKEIQHLFRRTWEMLDDYLLVRDGRVAGVERFVTTSITTSTVVSAPVHAGDQVVTFSRTYSSTPHVIVSGINGNTRVWAGVKSRSATAATVTCFSTSVTGTGSVFAEILGK